MTVVVNVLVDSWFSVIVTTVLTVCRFVTVTVGFKVTVPLGVIVAVFVGVIVVTFAGWTHRQIEDATAEAVEKRLLSAGLPRVVVGLTARLALAAVTVSVIVTTLPFVTVMVFVT